MHVVGPGVGTQGWLGRWYGGIGTCRNGYRILYNTQADPCHLIGGLSVT